MTGRWELRHGIQVYVGEFIEPTDDELYLYQFTGRQVRERMHPTCGLPGNGRKAHARAGTPICDVCRFAEAQYKSTRREMSRAG